MVCLFWVSPQIYRIQRFTAHAESVSLSRCVLVSNWQSGSKSYNRIFFKNIYFSKFFFGFWGESCFFGVTKSICFAWQYPFQQNLWQCLIHVCLLIAMLDEKKCPKILPQVFKTWQRVGRKNGFKLLDITIGFQVHQASYEVTISLKTVSPQNQTRKVIFWKKGSVTTIFPTFPSYLQTQEPKTRKSPRKRIFKSPEPEGTLPSKVTQTIKCEHAHISAHSPAKKAKNIAENIERNTSKIRSNTSKGSKAKEKNQDNAWPAHILER